LLGLLARTEDTIFDKLACSGNSKKCINESEIAERANVGIIEGQTQAKLPHLDLE